MAAPRFAGPRYDPDPFWIHKVSCPHCGRPASMQWNRGTQMFYIGVHGPLKGVDFSLTCPGSYQDVEMNIMFRMYDDDQP